MSKKVWLDAGHGGSDSGACGHGLKEADCNLVVCKEVGRLLEAHGVIVEYTRIGDTTVGIGERCKLANSSNADLFVSVHHNAGGGVGSENIYSVVGGISKIFAENIMVEFVANGRKNRRVFTRVGSDGRDYFGVIRDTKMPSVITEYGFIDNSEDVKSFDNPEGLKLEASAICKGILKTLGISYKGNGEGICMEAKKVIQEHCKFTNPDDVFNLMDKHKYAEGLYTKWMNSYK